MIQATSCIHVFSDMNTWIDFVIVLGNFEDFTKAEEIVKNDIYEGRRKAPDNCYDSGCKTEELK